LRIAGANGSGKTTLIRRVLEYNLKVNSVPQEKLFYLPQETTEADTQNLLAEVRKLPSDVRGRVCGLLAALGAPESILHHQTLSPGEVRKLALALGMGRLVWALILDEPTNHLDLPSVERLEEALANFPGAILLVSHDEEFVRRCGVESY
jgi:ATPase subunit of ABC transporter with duplicated ATPase domains